MCQGSPSVSSPVVQHACVGYFAYLFSNEPLISDESPGSENQRQDLYDFTSS